MRVSEDSVAMVTGAASETGQAFCRRLAALGMRVIAVDAFAAGVSGDSLVDIRDLYPLSADLAGVEGVARVLEAIRQRGPLHCLVNAAANALEGEFGRQTAQQQHQALSLQCAATVSLSRAAVPFMLEQGGGCILNLSALDSLLGAAGNPVAAACGAFINRFTLGLQAELAATPVRVRALCAPGAGAQPMAPDDLADAGLEALEGDAVLVVPGEGNRALARAALEGLAQALG